MKLLSIAIASYNMESFLDKCLESLTDPMIPDTLEVLVINDGSKDRTLEIANVYQKMFPNIIKVIDKANGNYGTCINKALEIATGKYFRPVDADDWVNSPDLIKLLKKLESCEADLVITGFSKITKGKTVQLRPVSIKADTIYEAKSCDFSERLLENFISMHNMTFKTSILKEIELHLSEGISFTDTQYCMMPICRIETIIYYDLNIYQYNMGRDGQSMQKSVLAKSIKAFYKLSTLLSEYYISNANNNNQTVRNNQRCFLRRVLFYFYTSAIVFGKNTPEENEMLNKLTAIIKQNKELENDVIKFHYMGIPFVFIWKKLNFRIFRFLPKSLVFLH